VSGKGHQPLEEVTYLQDCHPSKTASQLCRFLGMLNFYERFLPHAAATRDSLFHLSVHDVISAYRTHVFTKTRI
jgi:hypothetical protein